MSFAKPLSISSCSRPFDLIKLRVHIPPGLGLSDIMYPICGQKLEFRGSLGRPLWAELLRGLSNGITHDARLIPLLEAFVA